MYVKPPYFATPPYLFLSFTMIFNTFNDSLEVIPIKQEIKPNL